MYKQKIGISISNDYTAPISDVLAIIKGVGFDAVSPIWKEKSKLAETVAAAKALGLQIQSLHAPFYKASDLWSCDASISEPAMEELFRVVDFCYEHSIPITVVHTWIGFDYNFDKSALNYDTFDEVVRYAAEHNVKVAFENTEGEEYLAALMDAFKDYDNVGFCWDTGHQMCYNYATDMMELYGDRLICTHINDNLGVRDFEGKITYYDDLHLLPFDGIGDWNDITGKLNRCGYNDILTFELKIHNSPNRFDNEKYQNMRIEQYVSEAYARACRVATLKRKNIVKG